MKFFLRITLTMAGIVLLSCNNDKEEAVVAPVKNVTKKEVIENYANIAYENYKKAYDDAVILKSAITTFTTTPTQVNFDNAKNKWKVARESYGTTEAFRFANGPIDDDLKTETLLNSWPMDENFIDYVDGATNAGIINDPVLYPIIDKATLSAQNVLDIGELNVSVGYHAIEFLLWGQDLTAPSVKKTRTTTLYGLFNYRRNS